MGQQIAHSGFQRGRVKTGGRRKGVSNKTTATLKDAILMAGEEIGHQALALFGDLGHPARQLGGVRHRIAARVHTLLGSR